MAETTKTQGKIEDALETLAGLDSAGDLYVLARQTSIDISKLWAGKGGSALFRRVWLPPWVRDDACSIYELTWRVAHELMHVQQGIFVFGSLESEREAYITQCRVQLEMLQRQIPAPRDEIVAVGADLRTLESSFAAAKVWILKEGPYYAYFPDAQPRFWQVTEWWPQVWHALMSVRRNGQGGAS
jgi:hypothetical protein